MGRAIGEIVGGGFCIVTAAVGFVGGGAASGTGVLTLPGVAVLVGSAALAAGGVANVASGVDRLGKALSMSSGSGSSGPQAPAPAAGGTPAGQRINMPSWRKVPIDMEEVASGHMQGGWRLAAGNKKDVFPSNMTRAQVEKAIRHAYRHGEVLQSQGINGERVFVSGPFGSGRIEMWVNKQTKIIESAWPKF
jgi:hypothetical protein